ncbi:unnamed protein product [Ilex paraguariensis]|uniref:Uncharacterized protein n=1 Tax=Ilex paraguariensis TaxID=185542 RepID=A0ABC8U0Z9_9AQUA
MVLICRLIDRPLRPTMLKGFYHETQILSWVLSYDGLHAPDSLAITAAGIAVALSEVPNSKAIAGIRVGLIGDKFIVNPTTKEMEDSKLDLLLAGTDDAILMIEVNSCSFCFHRKLLAWANRHIFSTMGKVGLINLLELRILHGTRILYEMNMRTWQVSKIPVDCGSHVTNTRKSKHPRVVRPRAKIDDISVLKSSPRRSPRREARRGELISPGGPQAKRTGSVIFFLKRSCFEQ